LKPTTHVGATGWSPTPSPWPSPPRGRGGEEKKSSATASFHFLPCNLLDAVYSESLAGVNDENIFGDAKLNVDSTPMPVLSHKKVLVQFARDL
jgi:hypothetical protein